MGLDASGRRLVDHSHSSQLGEASFALALNALALFASAATLKRHRLSQRHRGFVSGQELRLDWDVRELAGACLARACGARNCVLR